MIKKYVCILLAILLCLLSACSLVDPPPEDTKYSPLIFDEDYLVGMFIYVEKPEAQNQSSVCLPTDDFNDIKAMYLYNSTVIENGVMYISFQVNGTFSDVSLGETNGGAVSNGKLSISATFNFTYELLNSILWIQNVYKKSDNSYYVCDRSGHTLMDMATSGGSTQTLSKSRTAIDGKKEEITYEGKNELKIVFVDYLINAKIIEFDSSNNVIKVEQINLFEANFETYKPSASCAYIIVEEEYEVKHESDFLLRNKGDRYFERKLINGADNQSAVLHVPNGDGFVNNFPISFDFSR